MQSFDPQDFMNSPPWPAIGSPRSLDDEKSVSGDSVDKDMVKYNTSKVYPEQQLNKASGNIRKSLDNGLSRAQHDTIDSDDLEPETSDSSERDYRLKINVSKSPSTLNGGGPKARKPAPKQTKSSETR